VILLGKCNESSRVAGRSHQIPNVVAAALRDTEGLTNQVALHHFQLRHETLPGPDPVSSGKKRGDSLNTSLVV
jgi:hypothetical protein